MDISRCELQVLSALQPGCARTQREIADDCGISLDSINQSLQKFKEFGLVDENDRTTEAAAEVLEPFRVRNAIILAAGVASRFAPLSYERPKAMFEVHGEILIERLIRQIKEAGISDITIVVGYMKEAFFYLEEKHDVNIVLNPRFADANNAYSLYCVRDRLGGTYVCSSDQYFSTNIFRPYVLSSTVTCVATANKASNYALQLGSDGRVEGVSASSIGDAYMQGPVYLDSEGSPVIARLLEEQASDSTFDSKLWDSFLVDSFGCFPLYAQALPQGCLTEFNYLSDLVAFDRDFFVNVDSHILDNICAALECSREDITDIEPVSAGLTNLSVLFAARGVRYVYRHPGPGTSEIINREAETAALEIARRLGLDETYIYEDPAEGWKISLYMDGCAELDYRDRFQVERALRMARTLHTSGESMPWSMDFMDESMRINDLLEELAYPMPTDHAELTAKVRGLNEAMQVDVGEPVLCHNDFYGPNFLVRGNDMWLIDWEYAAMGDYACDFGSFIAQGSGYTVEEATKALDMYYGRAATPEELRHNLAAVGIVGYYWYVWAMYQGAMGNPVGEWLYTWYKSAKKFTAEARELYGLER